MSFGPPRKVPVMTDSFFQSVAVVGGGAWGTAIAEAAARAGRDVVLWAREADTVEAINTTHENTPFLAGVPLSPAIKATGTLSDIAGADVIFWVTPAQFLGVVAAEARDTLDKAGKNQPQVICCKGIHIETGKLMSEMLADALPGYTQAILSGPTFAREVASGKPTAVTLSCDDAEIGMRIIETSGLPTFRPYLSTDPRGAEIGGAIKNVFAIACGIIDGKGLGDNARAALIARGTAEMVRLGHALGGKTETMMGLAGLGDLVLTCTSTQSRNFSLGQAIGQGQTMAEIVASRNSVAEGVTTALAVHKLAAKLGIEMPITAAVHAVLHEGAPIDQVIYDLLSRPFTTEY